MKHFLKDIVLTFAIAIGMVAAALPALQPYARNIENTSTYKRDYLEQNRLAIATLILGHSHTVVGFDASILDSAFNAALAARISYYDAAIVEQYVPQMPNLKAVVYPLACEYEAGAALLDNKSRFENIFLYKNYWDIHPPKALFKPKDVLGYNHYYISNIIHLGFYTQNILCDSLGLISMGESIGNGNNVYEAPGCEPMVTESLQKMAKVCNDHGVRLIVVTFPANSTYRASHADCDSRMQKVIDHVAGQYPVEYHCYLNDEQFGDSLFSDQTHLNHRGATAFAQRIKQDFRL